MKKILAVSGGVDSMVMLDMAAKCFPAEELIVATFDHRTRENSGDDARFAYTAGTERGLDARLGIARSDSCSIKSEEVARLIRYRFLLTLAEKERAEIWTAHHLDDLVESIAINIIRGTGPRGLAALSRPGIRRPFLDGTFGKVFDRRDILKYAAENKIIFRQDQSNVSDMYLRNRVREKTFNMSYKKKIEIYELWQEQKTIMHEIDEIIECLIPEDLRFEREWFNDLDENIAIEILRAGLLRAGISATRPQIRDFLDAIKTYESGKKFNLPGNKLVKINRNDFMLEV